MIKITEILANYWLIWLISTIVCFCFYLVARFLRQCLGDFGDFEEDENPEPPMPEKVVMEELRNSASCCKVYETIFKYLAFCSLGLLIVSIGYFLMEFLF